VRGLRLLYLGLGASSAALNPFIAVILVQHGFDSVAIGVVVAVAAAGSFGFMPVWGHIGDYVLGRRRTLRIVYLTASVAAIGFAGPVSGLALAVLMIVYFVSQSSCAALADSITVSTLSDPRREYGRMRMLASLAFGVVIIPLGFLYDRTGYGVASLLFIATALATALVLAFVPDYRPSSRVHQQSSNGEPAGVAKDSALRFGSTGLAFRCQPRLPAVLVTIFLAWSAVNVSFTFLSLRIVELGGGASFVAMSFGVSSLLEVPGMLLAGRVVAKVGLRGLFAFGALGYAAGFLSWAILTTPSAIVASRAITGVANGSLVVAVVLTIGEILPESLQATGQTLYQATAVGLAAVAGNGVGGWLYGLAGAPFLFTMSAVVLAAAALLGLLALPARIRPAEVPASPEDVILPGSPVT